MNQKRILVSAIILGAVLIFGLAINNVNADLWKHKGEFYCYDPNTTTKKEVLNAEEEGLTYINPSLSYLAEDEFDIAETICQGMLENGRLPADCNCIHLEGELTLEFEDD